MRPSPKLLLPGVFGAAIAEALLKDERVAVQTECVQVGSVPPLDPNEFLDDLKKTYVMKVQLVVHAGGAAASKADDEITFF